MCVRVGLRPIFFVFLSASVGVGLRLKPFLFLCVRSCASVLGTKSSKGLAGDVRQLEIPVDDS